MKPIEEDQARTEEGGPRSSWARSRPARAAARRATRAYDAAAMEGHPPDAALTNAAETVAGTAAGNCGQWDGAATNGREASVGAATAPGSMAQ